MNHLLALVGEYLAPIKSLKLEWSLKISEKEVKPRQSFLAWVAADTQYSTTQLHNLLAELDCPPLILAKHQRLSLSSTWQGVGVSFKTDTPIHSLFLQYQAPNSPTESRVSYQWHNKTFLSATTYTFVYLADCSPGYLEALALDPPLDKLFAELISSEELLATSGIYIQRKNNTVTEVYLTFPWQPRLATQSELLIKYLPTASSSLLATWHEERFRHLGFSCNALGQPTVTVYFNAPCAYTAWPTTFARLQSTVKHCTQRLFPLAKEHV